MMVDSTRYTDINTETHAHTHWKASDILVRLQSIDHPYPGSVADDRRNDVENGEQKVGNSAKG